MNQSCLDIVIFSTTLYLKISSFLLFTILCLMLLVLSQKRAVCILRSCIKPKVCVLSSVFFPVNIFNVCQKSTWHHSDVDGIFSSDVNIRTSLCWPPDFSLFAAASPPEEENSQEHYCMLKVDVFPLHCIITLCWLSNCMSVPSLFYSGMEKRTLLIKCSSPLCTRYTNLFECLNFFLAYFAWQRLFLLFAFITLRGKLARSRLKKKPLHVPYVGSLCSPSLHTFLVLRQ